MGFPVKIEGTNETILVTKVSDGVEADELVAEDGTRYKAANELGEVVPLDAAPEADEVEADIETEDEDPEAEATEEELEAARLAALGEDGSEDADADEA